MTSFDIFIGTFEQISHLFLVFLLLTLNKLMLADLSIAMGYGGPKTISPLSLFKIRSFYHGTKPKFSSTHFNHAQNYGHVPKTHA